MNRYTFRPLFSRLTGKPDGEARDLAGYYCDYCGAPIDVSHESDVPALVLKESGDSEQQWYYLELPGDLCVDTSLVFTEHEEYRYCMDWDREKSCCQELMKKYAGTAHYLFSAVYDARLRVAEDLLRKGVTPKELGLMED